MGIIRLQAYLDCPKTPCTPNGKTEDGGPILIDSKIGRLSTLIDTTLNTFGYDDKEDDDELITLFNVDKKTLQMIVKWMVHHQDDPKPKSPEEGQDKKHNDADDNMMITPWDLEFLKLPQSELVVLTLGANYMDIKGLYDLLCKNFARMMKGKTSQEVRDEFGIVNDMSPRLLKELRESYKWAENN